MSRCGTDPLKASPSAGKHFQPFLLTRSSSRQGRVRVRNGIDPQCLCVHVRVSYLVVISRLPGRQWVRKTKGGNTREERRKQKKEAINRNKTKRKKRAEERKQWKMARQRRKRSEWWMSDKARWWKRDGACRDTRPPSDSSSPPLPPRGATPMLHLRFISGEHIHSAWRWIAGVVCTHGEPVTQRETSNPAPVVSEDSSSWMRINVGATLPCLHKRSLYLSVAALIWLHSQVTNRTNTLLFFSSVTTDQVTGVGETTAHNYSKWTQKQEEEGVVWITNNEMQRDWTAAHFIINAQGHGKVFLTKNSGTAGLLQVNEAPTVPRKLYSLLMMDYLAALVTTQQVWDYRGNRKPCSVLCSITEGTWSVRWSLMRVLWDRFIVLFSLMRFLKDLTCCCSACFNNQPLQICLNGTTILFLLWVWYQSSHRTSDLVPSEPVRGLKTGACVCMLAAGERVQSGEF